MRRVFTKMFTITENVLVTENAPGRAPVAAGRDGRENSVTYPYALHSVWMEVIYLKGNS